MPPNLGDKVSVKSESRAEVWPLYSAGSLITFPVASLLLGDTAAVECGFTSCNFFDVLGVQQLPHSLLIYASEYIKVGSGRLRYGTLSDRGHI